MNDPKKFKHPKKRIASVDGILPDGRQLGVPSNRAYRPDRGSSTPSLDDFIRRGDGFHPLRQSPHGIGEQPEANEVPAANFSDEPIMLDETASKKVKKPRRGLLRRRKDKSKKDSKHPKLKKIAKRGALGLTALVLIAGGFFGVKLYLAQKHILKGGGRAPALADNIDITQLKGEGDGRVNILILGIGGPGHDGPDLTDTILLASIDPVNHTTALLSVPRDMWVSIPGHGYQKINAAYPYGKQGSKAKTLTGQEQDGLALLDKTLTPVIGVPIHYHMIVDFAAFKQAIDTVGGITINVPTQLYDPTIAWENGYNPVIAKAGVQTFNGSRALLYAKSRETSSDFARGERQRQVLVALKEKILSAGTYSNPVKVSQLLSSFGNNVYTDLSLGDTMRLYQLMAKIPSTSISSLDLTTPPHQLVTTANVNGLSVVRPIAGLFDYTAINSYVRNALRDSFLQSENATVAVYNATDAVGLATSVANNFKSYGYNVTTITSTPTATNPPKTILVDLSGGTKKYTRNYLEKRLKLTAVNSLPANSGVTPGVANFVIILGKDATPTTGQN